MPPEGCRGPAPCRVDLCNVFRLRYKRPATKLHAAEVVLFLKATKGDTVFGMTYHFWFGTHSVGAFSFLKFPVLFIPFMYENTEEKLIYWWKSIHVCMVFATASTWRPINIINLWGTRPRGPRWPESPRLWSFKLFAGGTKYVWNRSVEKNTYRTSNIVFFSSPYAQQFS